MEIKQECSLHNEFLIEVHDVRTGELKNTYKAYNIILDQGFNKIISHFQTVAAISNSSYRLMRPDTDTSGGNSLRFGGYIHVGTGTGTISPIRTQLFSFLYGAYTSYHEHNYNLDTLTGYYTQKITIEANQLVGQNITEVGLASYNTATYLSTHALIKDSEGNVISINKTAYDVITVYSKVYVSLTNNYGNNFNYVEGIYLNAIISLFTMNGSSYDGGANYEKYVCSVGNNITLSNKKSNRVDSEIYSIKYLNNNTNITYDSTNKKIHFYFRLDTSNGNGNVSEIGFGIRTTSFEQGSLTSNMTYPLFRSVLPITGVHDTSTTITAEEVGTGDGTKTEFNLKWNNIKNASQTIKVDGITTTAYTINNRIGNYAGRLLTPGKASTTGNCVAISHDNQYVAVGLSGSPYFELYKINVLSGVAEFVSELPLYKENIGYAVNSISFSHDSSYIAVGSQSASAYIYPFNVSTGVIGNLTSSVNLTYPIKAIQFTNDSNGIIIGTNASSGANIHGYIFNTINGTFGTKTITTTSGGGILNDLYLSKDNEYIIAGTTTTPFVHVYKFNKSTIALGTKSSNPATVPSAAVNSCAFTHDNKFIALGLSGATAITLYPFTTATGVIGARALGATMPGTTNSLAFSSASKYIVMGFSTSPYLKLYTFDPVAGTMGIEFTMVHGIAGACLDVIFTNNSDYLITAQAGGAEYYQYFNIYPFSDHRYNLKFNTPPANGLAITADYQVDYIPKDTNHVLDISFALQFADGNV